MIGSCAPTVTFAPAATLQCGFTGTEFPTCNSIPCMGGDNCALLGSSGDVLFNPSVVYLFCSFINVALLTDPAALSRHLLFKIIEHETMITQNQSMVIQLRQRADLAEERVRQHERLKFLGDLSLWVRDTHLRTLVNKSSFSAHLKEVRGQAGRRAQRDNGGRTRPRSPLDYLPGVVEYLNAGNSKEAMWMKDDDLRDIAVQNFETIAQATAADYDVGLLLQHSAQRNEQFYVAYPVLRNEATKAESLGRFLLQAPNYFYTLDSADKVEVERRMTVLTDIHDALCLHETDAAVEELFNVSR